MIHRPGLLKQVNKRHKTSHHVSKREEKRRNRGRVVTEKRSNIKSKSKIKADLSKKDRRNQQKQRIFQKRKKILEQKRFGTKFGPPKIIGLIGLGNDNQNKAIKSMMLKYSITEQNISSSTTTFNNNGMEIDDNKNDKNDNLMEEDQINMILKDFNERITLIDIKRNIETVLDASKICDTLIFSITASEDLDSFIDKKGLKVIELLRYQGFPSIIITVQNIDSIKKKKQNKIKKEITEAIKYQLPYNSTNMKIIFMTKNEQQNVKTLGRWIHEQKIKKINWKKNRPFLLVDKFQFISKQQQQQNNNNNGMVPLLLKEDSEDLKKKGTLKIYGYLRGKTISANQLIHLVNIGTYQIERICEENEPLRYLKKNKKNNNDDEDDDEEMGGMTVDEKYNIISKPDSKIQQSLVSSLEPDLMANQEAWVTDADIENAKKEVEGFAKNPEGLETSYKDAWLIKEDEKENNQFQFGEDYYDDDDKNNNEKEEYEKMMMIDDENDNNNNNNNEKNDDFKFDLNNDNNNNGNEMYDSDDDEKMDDKEREKEREKFFKQLREDENDELRYPDEVDTPSDKPARVRFQRYRGLKSFRHSPWDPKENLPLDYSRIFQFDDFKHSRKLAFGFNPDFDDVDIDSYISIHIKNFEIDNLSKLPQNIFENKNNNNFNNNNDFNDFNNNSIKMQILLAFGLFKHEQKTSVVHVQIKRNENYLNPIKSKEELLFQIGFRYYKTKPIFSEYNPKCEKAKFERFWYQKRWQMATFFAPVTFGNEPVIVYKKIKNENGESKLEVIGNGVSKGVDADKIILKKIVLSGYPRRVTKKNAKIRYMFYNPDDIRYFKPIELYTKNGKRGVIVMPIGTHGKMKCTFNSPLQQNDVVHMPLYKRVFPKWNTKHQNQYTF